MLTMKFGIEIEFFGCDNYDVERALTHAGINASCEHYNHDTRNHWKLVSDASVDEEGNELVSPILIGDEGIEELKTVLEVLSQCGAKVNKSCGLHIHHDASTFTLNDFKNLYVFMYNYKEVFDSMLPKSRRDGNNQYCCGLQQYEIEDILESETIRNITSHVMNNRYKTLNIQAYVRHGSIEFRQHNGSLDFEKISKWIELTFRAVCYAKTQSETGINVEINTSGTLKEKLFRFRNDLHIFNTPLSKFINARVIKFVGTI